MGSDQAQPQPQSTHQPHEPQPDSIVAICENRKLEVGMACLRMSDYSVELSQVADDQAYSKAVTMLARHEPRLLLFHTRGDVLERICKAEFPQTRIDHLARSNWSPERGLTAVRHYSARSVAAVLGTDVQAKYLCLSALSALVFFFEEVQKMQLVKGTLRISHRPCDGVMLLDPSTIANLEILRNLRTSCPKASLFGVLNQCKTAAGARMLRSSLTQPSKDLDTIQLRVEAVSELLPRDEALIDLAKILPQFAESDRLLRQLVQRSELSNAVARARESIKTILLLKQTLRAAPVLAASLTSNGEVPLANEVRPSPGRAASLCRRRGMRFPRCNCHVPHATALVSTHVDPPSTRLPQGHS